LVERSFGGGEGEGKVERIEVLWSCSTDNFRGAGGAAGPRNGAAECGAHEGVEEQRESTEGGELHRDGGIVVVYVVKIVKVV
jgi:hypothetical protein